MGLEYSANHVSRVHQPGGDIALGWDDSGLRSVKGPDFSMACDYDGADLKHVDLVQQGASASIEYEEGLPSEVVDFGGATWARRYDNFGDLTSLRDPSGAETTFRYNRDGYRVEEDLPNGALIKHTYSRARANGHMQLTSINYVPPGHAAPKMTPARRPTPWHFALQRTGVFGLVAFLAFGARRRRSGGLRCR
jgi:YD repeat-containing protein